MCFHDFSARLISFSSLHHETSRKWGNIENQFIRAEVIIRLYHKTYRRNMDRGMTGDEVNKVTELVNNFPYICKKKINICHPHNSYRKLYHSTCSKFCIAKEKKTQRDGIVAKTLIHRQGQSYSFSINKSNYIDWVYNGIIHVAIGIHSSDNNVSLLSTLTLYGASCSSVSGKLIALV